MKLFLIIITILFLLVYLYFDLYFYWALAVTFGIIVFVLMIGFKVDSNLRSKRSKDDTEKLISVVNEHIDALSNNYIEAMIVDEYGNKDDKNWIKKLDYFHDKVLIRNFPEGYILNKKKVYKRITRLIEDYLDE